MLKKLVLGASLGVLTLAAAGAIAGGPDEAAAVAAPASTSGFYVLGQAGYAWNNLKSVPKSIAKQKKNGFTGRVAAGYQLNQYIAFDAGFMMLPTQKLSNSLESFTARQYVYDARVKGMIPVSDNFYGYGLAGVALVHTSSKLKTVYPTVPTPVVVSYHSTSNKVLPELGAGAAYKLTPNVAVFVEYDHIFQGKNKYHDVVVPGTNMVTTGLQYSF